MEHIRSDVEESLPTDEASLEEDSLDETESVIAIKKTNSKMIADSNTDKRISEGTL